MSGPTKSSDEQDEIAEKNLSYTTGQVCLVQTESYLLIAKISDHLYSKKPQTHDLGR